jgi:hypothetical protein
MSAETTIKPESKPDRNAQAVIRSSDLLGVPLCDPDKSGFNGHDKTEGKEEWLTPPEIIKALGSFDLDPCAPTPETRPWDTAKAHYCIHDNGLIKPWNGRVWLNPPYGGETARWMARASDHGDVTALIFARTETQQFFDYIWPKAKAVCFLKGRLAFYHIAGKRGGTAGAPSMLVAWDGYNASKIEQALKAGTIAGKFVWLNI